MPRRTHTHKNGALLLRSHRATGCLTCFGSHPFPHLPSPLSNVDKIHHGVVLILPNPIAYRRTLKINVLVDFLKCDSECALVTIELLCRVPEGCGAFEVHELTVSLLVKTIMKILDRVIEYAAGELLSMCSASEKSQNKAVLAGVLTQVKETRVRREKGLEMRKVVERLGLGKRRGVRPHQLLTD